VGRGSLRTLEPRYPAWEGTASARGLRGRRAALGELPIATQRAWTEAPRRSRFSVTKDPALTREPKIPEHGLS
jgi:hypothetical protein